MTRLLDRATSLTRLSLVFALAGCAAMHAYREERARYQALADQATDHFNKTRVSVMLTSGGVSTYTAPNNIKLNTGPGFERSRTTLAHELGHHILEHHLRPGESYEMDANAMAVQVLRVWGYSEPEAIVMVGEWLCRRQARGASASMPGHAPAAVEIDDLKTRFHAPTFRCSWNVEH